VQVKKSAVSGKILEATNMDDTPLTSDEMSSLNALGGKKVHSAQTLIDPDTKKVVTQQVLSDGTMRYMSGGKVYTGNKDALIPEPAFTAQENKKTLASEKSASKKEETQQKAEDRRVEAAIKALEKRIPNPTMQQRQQALVAAGVPADRIEQEMGLAEGSLAGKLPVAPVQETPVSQAPAAVPVAPGAQPAPAPAARPAAAPAPRSETTIGQLGPRPIEPSPVDPGPGETAESAKARNKSAQDTYKAELANWTKQKERFDKREEELPTKQAATQDTLDLIDRFIKHPGFADVVGVPGVTGILNIPLTDARAARQLYNQIDADTFLQGFERLRGGGSITEVEGQQAKQAVAALRDRYITEDEFKKNAKIYTDILKRGINKERQQLGLTPLYPDVKDTGADAGNLTPAQKAAAELERRKKGQ
jgi:flagellar motility protein MotE (MotC chaperone)